MSLPTDDRDRKALPVFRGNLMYFPLANLAVAEVSRVGNDQHNPGEPLHWAREKSVEQMDTAERHMMDHAMGQQKDTDGTWHLAKAIWRLKAELELAMEAAQARGEKLFTGKRRDQSVITPAECEPELPFEEPVGHWTFDCCTMKCSRPGCKGHRKHEGICGPESRYEHQKN